MTDLLATSGGAAPDLLPEQRRRLVTELPGPRSRELMARRVAAVSFVLRFLPPLVIGQDLLGEALDVLETVVAAEAG